MLQRWAKGDDDTPKPTKKNVSESESGSEDEEHEEYDNHHSDANNSNSEKGDISGKDVDTGDDEEESGKSSDESKKIGRRKGMLGCTMTRKESTPPTPVKVRSSATPKIPAKTSSLKKTNSEKINDSSEKVFSRKKKTDAVPKKKSTKVESKKSTNSGTFLVIVLDIGLSFV